MSKEAWIKLLNTATQKDLERLYTPKEAAQIIQSRKTPKWKRECAEILKARIPKRFPYNHGYPKESVIVGFTEEYRDRHWRKCRHGCDPRHCGSCRQKRRDVDDKRIKWRDPNYLPICDRDTFECDAEWTGEKDISLSDEIEEEV